MRWSGGGGDLEGVTDRGGVRGDGRELRVDVASFEACDCGLRGTHDACDLVLGQAAFMAVAAEGVDDRRHARIRALAL
jgi:hypothetical protein